MSFLSEKSFAGLAMRLGASLLAVAGVTAVFSRLLPVNATTVGFLYLITVLVIATRWGLLEAAAASVLATLCFNYFFLPPVGTFTIADPQNWVALSAFLATSLVASQLSERAKRRTREAESRRLEMERLYALGRAILLRDRSQHFAKHIAREIARIYELPSVMIYDRADGTTHRGGPRDAPELAAQLHEAAITGTLYRDQKSQTVVGAISLGGQPIGAVAIAGGSLSDSALQALSQLIAIGLERVRDQQAATRADAARESEEFKSTLLDALAHEFKTPLTSIKAATSSMLSAGVSRPEEQREFLTIIDQEAERLTTLVSEAIHLARIEAGQLQFQRQPRHIRQVVEATLRKVAPLLEDREIRFSLAADLPEVSVDEELAQLALRQLIDNAVKYSPPATPITFSAEREGGLLVLRVHNVGLGIPEEERDKIFEKFYRGARDRQHGTGSGLGLAIAREILHVHGGALSVESNPGRGVEFIASFPLASKEVPS